MDTEAVSKARHTVLDTVSPEKSHVIIRRFLASQANKFDKREC
jgi:hypothetical protein